MAKKNRETNINTDTIILVYKGIFQPRMKIAAEEGYDHKGEELKTLSAVTDANPISKGVLLLAVKRYARKGSPSCTRSYVVSKITGNNIVSRLPKGISSFTVDKINFHR